MHNILTSSTFAFLQKYVWYTNAQIAAKERNQTQLFILTSRLWGESSSHHGNNWQYVTLNGNSDQWQYHTTAVVVVVVIVVATFSGDYMPPHAGWKTQIIKWWKWECQNF